RALLRGLPDPTIPIKTHRVAFALLQKAWAEKSFIDRRQSPEWSIGKMFAQDFVYLTRFSHLECFAVPPNLDEFAEGVPRFPIRIRLTRGAGVGAIPVVSHAGRHQQPGPSRRMRFAVGHQCAERHKETTDRVFSEEPDIRFARHAIFRF